MKLVHVAVNAQFISLRHVLKLFFELPNIYDETIEYITKLNSNEKIVHNLIQGNYWKNRSKE